MKTFPLPAEVSAMSFLRLTNCGALPGLAALAAVALLAGCKGGGMTAGGGSGSGSGYKSSYDPPAPVSGQVLSDYYLQSFTTSQEAAAAALLTRPAYDKQNTDWCFLDSNSNCLPGQSYHSFPLASANVQYAHILGLTGAGVTVAEVDTRLRTTHEALAGTTIQVVTNQDPLSDAGTSAHGTMVASIITGKASTGSGASTDFIGVAPDVNLIFGHFESWASMTATTNAALAAQAVAENNSWGFDEMSVSQVNYNSLFSSAEAQAYLGALEDYANYGVVVFALSNTTTLTHSTIMDALPYINPDLEAGWLAVANGTPTFALDGSISSVTLQSASCLEAARWCLVADGTWTAATDVSDTSYDFGIGSSFAAPQVTAALAILAQAFPTLSPHDLRIRLMASANDDFFTADDYVTLADGFNKGYSFTYGLGFLDLKAALLPIGATSLTLADGSVASAEKPLILSGSAMGDAVTNSLKGVEVAVSDSLKAPFKMDGRALEEGMGTASLGSKLLGKSLTADLGAARTASAGISDRPFDAWSGLQVAHSAGGIDTSVLLSDDGDFGKTFGFDLRKTVSDGPTRVELGLKLTHDAGSVMGFGGTDGSAASNMVSLELGLTQDIGQRGFLTLSGEAGLADLGSQAALASVSSANFNAVKMGVGQHDLWKRGDKLAFAVGLPIAVSSGRATAVLPTVSALGVTSYTPVDLNLAPDARQLDLSVTYQTQIRDGLEMLLSLAHSDNLGNRADLKDTAGVLALTFSF